MCRNTAQKLSAAFAEVQPGHLPRVRLVAAVHEVVEDEIEGFAEFWPHEIVFDPEKRLYKALFDGKVRSTSVLRFSVDFVNPRSSMSQSWNLAKQGNVGDKHNFKGNGLTHGGLFVISARGLRLLYEFTEEHIGHSPDPQEVIKRANISVL